MQGLKRIMIGAVCFVVACFSAQDAFANVALPFVFVTVPGMVLALLPVVIVEAYVIKKQLHVPYESARSVSISANLCTTFLGVPLTWVVAVIAEIICGYYVGCFSHSSPIGKVLGFMVLGSVILLDPTKGNDDFLFVALQSAWILVPCFFASWWIEYLVAAKKLKDIPKKQVKTAIMWANLYSYGALEVVFLTWTAYILVQRCGFGLLGNISCW